ncbi:hypothetical protein [Pseudanabaena sp. PCC 6802]|nr:hypothetical protein [Pseudanabaena sp. PCC 6802]
MSESLALNPNIRHIFNLKLQRHHQEFAIPTRKGLAFVRKSRIKPKHQ